MVASNQGPSRRSTRIFFEELSRIAEKLQNVTPEDTITCKEPNRGFKWITIFKVY